MTLALLSGPSVPFPPVEQALREPDGLLAVGGDLSPQRLLAAYQRGIFPWFSAGDPILWWSPDPRCVLETANVRPGRHLRRALRRVGEPDGYEVRVDTAFAEVIAQCAAPRASGPGTWILPELQAAYRTWHRMGYVHAIETYHQGELVGGLYGVSVGAMFYGESMFTRADDAARVALLCLTVFLARHGVTLIDCQQATPHMLRLGARLIPRRDFAAHVARAVTQPTPPWQPGRLLPDGTLLPLSPEPQPSAV